MIEVEAPEEIEATPEDEPEGEGTNEPVEGDPSEQDHDDGEDVKSSPVPQEAF